MPLFPELARHLIECKNCFPVWDDCKVLCTEHNDRVQVIRETLKIGRKQY